MTVLIKGMEMPSYCDDCWALDEYGDYPVCQITEEQRGYNFRTREKRMDKCPLVEVPTPHGRLIDADAFFNKLWEMRRNYQLMDDTQTADKLMHGLYRAEQTLQDMPTIIEAEEEAE